jgi:hypothetical protein
MHAKNAEELDEDKREIKAQSLGVRNFTTSNFNTSTLHPT